jgi:hypothetical protein
MRTNGGADAQAAAMGGDLVGATGSTTTAPTSTTATDSGATFGTLTGHIVVMGNVYGVITSNTATVLTVDRWTQVTAPGGSAASTPSSGTYVVLPGQAPYWFMALTADSTTPGATDTGLSGEITTSGGGLVRRLCTYSHTGGSSSYALAATYTANGTDVLPVTIAKIGIFNTLTGNTGRMQFETLLATSATLSASGDQLTVTDTVSM